MQTILRGSIKPTSSESCEKQYSNSLDTTHRQFMDTFREQETSIIPQLKANYNKLKRTLSSTNNIDKRIEIEDNLHDILKRIKQIEHTKKKIFPIKFKIRF
jgi:hypothetical protein